MNPKLKFLLATVAAVLLFLIINLTYFSKGLSGDYVLSQGDVRNFKGAAKEIQDYREQSGGKEALWTNSMFGGMPAYQISVFYANRALGVLNQVLQLFLPQPMGMVFLYFIGFFILLMCMKVDPWLAIIGALAFGFSSYFFIIIEAGHNTKAVAIGYAPPLLGGIILLFRQKWLMGFVVTTLFMGLEIYANHPQITYYLFLLVGIFLLVELIGLIIEKKVKEYFIGLALMVVALGIGVAPNIGNLWTTAEYGKYTTRGPSDLTIKADRTENKDKAGLQMDYATDWSYGVGESFSLLVPNYKGGASDAIGQKYPEKLELVDEQYQQDVGGSNTYFGDQPFTSGPVYAGAIVVLLSIAGMFIIKNRIKWVLLVGSLMALALSWGRNFPALTELFFNYFPYYNKFRAVSMLLVIVELALPLLAVLTVQQLIDTREERRAAKKMGAKGVNKLGVAKIGALISVGVVALFLLLCLAFPRAFNTFHSSDEDPSVAMEKAKTELKKRNPGIGIAELNQQVDKYSENYNAYLEQVEIPRISIFRADVGRSLLFVLIGAAVLLLSLFMNLNNWATIGILGFFILVDMWMVNWRYLNKDSYRGKEEEQQFDYFASDDWILRNEKSLDYRVASSAVNTFNNSTVSYYHKSIGGYHGAKLKRYQELREFHLDRELQYANFVASNWRMPDSMAAMYLTKTPVLNMLNTKYFITQQNRDSIPYLNKSANGNAWFVSNIKWAPNADSEIVWTGSINSKIEAVINEKTFGSLKNEQISPTRDGKIEMLEYQPNYLKYKSSSNAKQLAVFSEIYYPAGWNAYIDNNPAPHICANYVLRAMVIPKGDHLIEFKFEPKSYFTGEKISTVGVYLYYLVVLGGMAFAIMQVVKSMINKKK